MKIILQAEYHTIYMNEERQLKAMRLLKDNPEMTQRELASNLGISLGAENFK